MGIKFNPWSKTLQWISDTATATWSTITGKPTWVDNTEEAFTTALKNKLDTLSNYTHPTGDGNLHVPANGTTNTGKVLKATNVAGSIGWGTLNYSDVGASPSNHMHTIAQISNFPTFSRLTLGVTQPTDGYWLKVVE